MKNNEDHNLIEIITIAGKELVDNFDQRHKTFKKGGESNYSLMIEQKIEQTIIAGLLEIYPDATIIPEEGQVIRGDGQVLFFLDPLDGTNNYWMHFPYFSVALTKVVSGAVEKSFVYEPILDKLYSHRFQECDLKKLTPFNKSYVAYASSYTTDPNTSNKIRVILEGSGVERFLCNWSPHLDLCRLASGQIHAMILNSVKTNDLLAGAHIAFLSGASFMTNDGRFISDPDELLSFSTGVVACDASLATSIYDELKSYALI